MFPTAATLASIQGNILITKYIEYSRILSFGLTYIHVSRTHKSSQKVASNKFPYISQFT